MHSCKILYITHYRQTHDTRRKNLIEHKQSQYTRKPSLPHQNDCKTRGTIVMHTKKRLNTEPHKQREMLQTMNQKQQNHRLRTDCSLSHWWGGGLNACRIITLKSVVVETTNIFCSHGDFVNRVQMKPFGLHLLCKRPEVFVIP